MLSLSRILPFLTLVLASSSAFAQQDFNVDIGDQTPPFVLPSALYGAGAMVPGTWNSVSPTLASPMLLVDVTNTPTTATLSLAGGVGAFDFDNAGTSGDDQNLMDDCQGIGAVGASTTWTFANLAGGSYSLYTYAWNPQDAAAVSTVSGGTLSSPQTCGGAWPGTQTQGVTYTVHFFTVAAGGSIAITIMTTAGFGTLGGFQLVQAVFVESCFGDGTGTACPCGNFGSAGNGCANSINPAGAHISASGSASISADTLVLMGTGMANASALYFQGTLVVGGGSGVAFGDGLRCAGGSVVRLGVKNNVGGASQYPAVGDPPVSVQGGIVMPVFRYYQVWYRNAAAFCTASTFNLSETVCVPWTP